MHVRVLHDEKLIWFIIRAWQGDMLQRRLPLHINLMKTFLLKPVLSLTEILNSLIPCSVFIVKL